MLSRNSFAQAISLGFAVGANQMFGACGPILFAHWLTRFGLQRALGLTFVSLGVLLTIIAPFLLWNPQQFLFVAFMLPRDLSPKIMSGQFTLLPLIATIVPHASIILTSLSTLVAAFLAWRAKSAEGVIAAMAIGLCGTLSRNRRASLNTFFP